MSKKTVILIILLVVAAFIAWKKGLFAKLTGGSSTNYTPAEPASASTDDLEGIIEQTSMTAIEKKRCLEWAKNIENWARNNDKWTVKGVEDKAIQNGVTYKQQIVLDAIWQMHVSDNLFGKDFANKIMTEVKSM